MLGCDSKWGVRRAVSHLGIFSYCSFSWDIFHPDIYKSFLELESELKHYLSERPFLIPQCEMSISSYSISPPSVLELSEATLLIYVFILYLSGILVDCELHENKAFIIPPLGVLCLD